MDAHLLNKVGLHSNYNNWSEFLSKRTVLKETTTNYAWYIEGNCHYIVDSNGLIELHLGYHGQLAWNKLTKV